MSSLLLGLLYFAPLIVGILRRRANGPRSNLWQVVVLDVFFGWTVVGWLFAWVFVFPTLKDLFAATIIKIFGRRGGAGAGPGAPQPAFGEGQPSHGSSPCGHCGGSRVQTCPQCSGRGSWYEQPQTATGTAQLVQCSYCTSSGRVTCQTCSGSGRSAY
jgi:hypothetical protein